MSRCKNCGYFWQEEDERYAQCHYVGPEDWAPCAQDDYGYEDVYENVEEFDYNDEDEYWD